MLLLVPAHLGCPGQIPQSHKTVVCVCVCASATAGVGRPNSSLISCLYQMMLLRHSRLSFYQLSKTVAVCFKTQSSIYLSVSICVCLYSVGCVACASAVLVMRHFYVFLTVQLLTFTVQTPRHHCHRPSTVDRPP